ncbi:pirin [Elysia marginata]|uniref:Pirin n=1 Tax=Elysia marginata TaxID=1093978 RepID=A0AAV4IDD0_9GAST|nr:pirin [Elysia marginata]
MSRTVDVVFESKWQDEGVGARVRRSIGRSELRNFDPFLLCDEFCVRAPAGFPDHPHRGFETVTYMLEGEMNHQDFMGHKGKITAGDLQWMTAGRGILHCEMPGGKADALGIQLWVNLKRADKLVEPAYQELVDKDIPRGERSGVKVKVIAGEAFGIKSPVYTRTPTSYLDFVLSAGSKLEQPINRDWNCFAYILSGEALFGPEGQGKVCTAHHTVALKKDGDLIRIENKEEIQQAMSDYHGAKNGFENAATWNSDYAH